MPSFQARINTGRLRGAPIRFLVVGGANTFATSALLLGLSYLMPGWIAYSVAFVAGILIAVVLNGKWVFKSKLSLSRILLYSSVYVGMYFLGVVIISGLSEMGLPPFMNVTTILVTAPIGYFAGRFIFKEPSTKES